MSTIAGEFIIDVANSSWGPTQEGGDGARGWFTGVLNGGNTCGSAVTSPPILNGITFECICNDLTNEETFYFKIIVDGTLDASIFNTVEYQDQNGEEQLFQFASAGIDTSNAGYTIFSWEIQGGQYFVPASDNTLNFTWNVPPPNPSTPEFNCDCTMFTPAGIELQTLTELRYRMMVRLGYAAAAKNPPPGMNDLLYEFLYNAQVMLYKNHKELHTERFFSWTMVPGIRFYGLQSNTNNDTGDCFYTIDPYKVTWVGFEDLNQAWYQLQKGIDPILYTRVQISTGWPTNYEIRQCIEIFPAPKSAYTLWLKGHIGLLPFPNDSSDPQTTIDSEAVFLLALANAKAHYGQKDAQLVAGQAGAYVRDLVAGTHQTATYVPRTRVANPATPPKFLPLDT